MHLAFAAALVVATSAVKADPQPFTGNWYIDLRNQAERARGAECGGASFELTQDKDRVAGTHSMATVDCSRINEGEPGSVKGIVVKDVAVLSVTSSRNGAIVLGTARVSGGKLHWQSREDIRPGEPDADSPLILRSGVLLPRGK